MPKVDEQFWQKALVTGDPMLKRWRRTMRHIPSAPRCALCYVPFRGLGGRITSLMGSAPSRKNPRYCNACFEKAPHGGVEIDVGVLFVDLRDFTSLAERTEPEIVARELNRFYAIATDVLCDAGAVIDKLAGDGLLALFIPILTGEGTPATCVEAAANILREAGYGSGDDPWLRLAGGADYGRAFVGNVGAGEVKDFTAIGDVVNTASRLQSHAQPGQLALSERLYREAGVSLPGTRVELELKGKSEPVSAYVLDLAPTPVAAPGSPGSSGSR